MIPKSESYLVGARQARAVVVSTLAVTLSAAGAAKGAVADAKLEPSGAAGVGIASPAASREVPDIAEQLGTMAVQANPSVEAIKYRIAALQEKVERAKVWMDPVLSAEYSSMPIDAPYPGQHPMSGIQLTIKQTLYWPGKVAAREDEALNQVRQARLTLAEQKVQLRATVKRAYYRLALVRQLRAVTERHIALVSDLVAVAKVKNAAGLGGQHEQLRLQVLVEQLQDDLGNFDRDDVALTSAINATLHRSLDVPVATPATTQVLDPSGDALTFVHRAERDRPLLARFKADAAAYQAAARRAEREGYPDITVWAGYRVRTESGTDPGTDFVSLGVSIPLPITYDSRWGSERRQNEKMAAASLKEREAALDDIRGQAGRTVAGWKRAVRQARVYRQELTPGARMTLDATFASYQVGRSDFASLFQAELQLLDFERAARRAEAAAAEASVEIEALIGNGVE